MEEFDIIKKRQPPPPKQKRKGDPVDSSAQIPEDEKLIPFVDQVFGGQLASVLICNSCKHVRLNNCCSMNSVLQAQVSHTYEPFMDISLSIRSEEDKETKVRKLPTNNNPI